MSILTCPQKLIMCSSRFSVWMRKVDKSFINVLCVHQQAPVQKKKKKTYTAIQPVCPRHGSPALIPSFPSRIRLRIRGGEEIHNLQKHSVHHFVTQMLLPCTLTQ